MLSAARGHNLSNLMGEPIPSNGFRRSGWANARSPPSRRSA